MHFIISNKGVLVNAYTTVTTHKRKIRINHHVFQSIVNFKFNVGILYFPVYYMAGAGFEPAFSSLWGWRELA